MKTNELTILEYTPEFTFLFNRSEFNKLSKTDKLEKVGDIIKFISSLQDQVLNENNTD
jgi:hypothetical protein